MMNFDINRELSQFKRKSIEALNEDDVDFIKPIEEIATSIKNIEKVSKKNTMQMEAYIETLKNENQTISDEAIKLRADLIKSNQTYNKTIKSLILILDQIDELYKFAVYSQNENWITSLNNIHRVIDKRLNEIGISEIPALGETFCEDFHNCVEAIVNSDKMKHEIVGVRKKGYLLNGEAIRPADVVVVG